jgi:hypothetical protein
MHLLEYAQKKSLKLDIEEYAKMFRTSVVRIALSAFLPRNVDALDPALFKKTQNEASGKAKKFFETETVLKTPEDI